jgi:KipI family sensor histidine kinase inhibitor
MRILPAGACALLVEVGSLAEVLALRAALAEQEIAGVVDIIPAARTVLVEFDPDQLNEHQLAARLRSLRYRDRGAAQPGPVVDIEVRYDGPDLDEVGEVTGLGRSGVVDAHSGQLWTVAFGGFAPGFAYLTGENDTLHVPRRDTPRTSVPAGSVGLAGEFSGIYPRSSPGGWQLIGSADAQLWDAERDPPALLRPGVRVRFRAAR